MSCFRSLLRLTLAACLLLSAVGYSPLLAADVRLESKDDRVTVWLGEEVFTEYIFKGYEKPILYPVIGPAGIGMTRNWPMRDDAENEAHDHPHHKSIWFGHMDVNGENFWATGENAGTTVSKSVTIDGNTIHSQNDLIGRGGKLVATDSREISFSADGETRVIDYAVTYHASQGDIIFGDNKDGQMGIRMNPHLRIKGPVANGQAVNSTGVTTADIWGKRADWIDYWGTVDGDVVGIAIFDHPSNLRHPTWWHARDYGLVSANPFGRQDFEGEQAESGDYKLPSGESLTFKHRFVIHRGDAQAAGVDKIYREWAGK